MADTQDSLRDEETDALRSFDALRRAHEELEELVARQPRGAEAAWLERVRGVARRLFDALKEHQDLAEEDDGAISQVTGQKPGLMSASQRLELEHADMLHRATELEIDAERQIASQDYNIQLIRLEARVLSDILLLHLVRADTLMYEAYFQVEGGEGG